MQVRVCNLAKGDTACAPLLGQLFSVLLLGHILRDDLCGADVGGTLVEVAGLHAPATRCELTSTACRLEPCLADAPHDLPAAVTELGLVIDLAGLLTGDEIDEGEIGLGGHG